MLEFFRDVFKKVMGGLKSFEKDGRTKDCFFHDSSQCKGKIIKAHSLQKNGVLSILESDVGGKKVVYSFQWMKKNRFDQYLGFLPIGKGAASTFHGFCAKHDREIFSAIENQGIDISNDEHKFLLCYRALARCYHRKIELLKSFRKNALYNHPNLEKEQQSGVSGSNAALSEMEEHKELLNELLETFEFDRLRYFTHTFDYQVPVACSSVMTPKYFLDKSPFNLTDDLNVNYEQVYLTVIPTTDKTHILYACIPSHTRSMNFINDLQELSDTDLGSITSGLMVNEVENGFISPRIFEELSDDDQSNLIKMIELSDKGVLIQLPYDLGFNFFDSIFSSLT